MNYNYVFFLGGYDLEMVTIKKILEENKIPFFDHKLKWGARLSEYKEELSIFSLDQIPIFIELNLDMVYPSTAIIIDHHNNRAGKDKKTSLEQVANLLGIELDRWQQLVSANDKGYVWGMQDIAATEDEIKEIREFDKKCQGVINEDEEKAKKSIEHFLTPFSCDTVIIESLTEKTSVVTDLVYKLYKHIFIITPSKKFSYSGSQQIIEIIEKYYSELKSEDGSIETWYGGYLPDHGYFGSNHAITKKEIIKLMGPFSKKERIHSQHIFMFPFNIVHTDILNCQSSSVRLKEINRKIVNSNSNWNYKEFEILNTPIKLKNEKSEPVKRVNYSADEIWAYNENKYFHEYVRDTLFNKTTKDKLFKSGSDQPISLYYEGKVLPTDEMIIFVRSESNGTKEIINYTLRIEHLSLRIFETGIGILTITLCNECKNDIESILRINDYGRRIYPQFLGEQFDIKDDPINAVKDAFLPEKIIFRTSGIEVIDEFETNDYLSEEKHFAKYIESLLNPFHDEKENKLAITPIIDDRMFVVCWYENDRLMNKLKTYRVNDSSKLRNGLEQITDVIYGFETDSSWYQYIFVDGSGPLVQNIKMKMDLIDKATYSRFIARGVLYGITRYSFMCLSSEGWFPYNIVRNHMQKMYYQMAAILLAQRASIIKFNKELETISEDADKLIIEKNSNKGRADKRGDFKKIIARAERLNKDIILFSNRIWFEEISPQEQGIELYKLGLKNMDIENQYSSLQSKVNQLYDFIRIKLEQQKTENIERLTVISIIFALIVCMLTFWAIDFNFLRYWKGIETATIETDKGFREELIHVNILNTIFMFFFSSLAVGSALILMIRLKLKFIFEKKGWLLWVILIVSLMAWTFFLKYN